MGNCSLLNGNGITDCVRGIVRIRISPLLQLVYIYIPTPSA